MRGPAFFAYSDNYLIEMKFGIIMDVEASRAIRQAEVWPAKTMTNATEQRSTQAGTAPGHRYGSGANLNGWSTRRRSAAYSRWSTSAARRRDLQSEDFSFDRSKRLHLSGCKFSPRPAVL